MVAKLVMHKHTYINTSRLYTDTVASGIKIWYDLTEISVEF